MKKIKVCIIYFGKLNTLTGVSTVLKNLFFGFKDNDSVRLDIISLDTTSQDKIPFIDKVKTNNTTYSNNNFKAKIKNILFRLKGRSTLLSFILSWLSYDLNAIKISKIQSSIIGESDILFFHDLFSPYYFRRNNKILWNSKKKVVVLHNNGEPLKMFWEYFPKLKESNYAKRHYWNMVNVVLDNSDQIVLLSSFAKNNFEKLYPQHSNKCVIIRNGLIEFDTYKTPQEPIIKNNTINFVTVGTISERKGYDIIINALNLIPYDKRPQLNFKFIGDGPIKADLKQKALDLNLTNIEFLGSQKNPHPFLRNSDIFLLPSRNEGLPMAIIEALSCGLPIISTNVGGIPELVINEYNGWLIEPNPSELCEIFKLLIESSFDLSKFGQNSMNIFNEHYSLKQMIYNYSLIFTKLTSND